MATCLVSGGAVGLDQDQQQNIQQALPHPALVCVHQTGPDSQISDEPEGGSPTSDRSASVQMCGSHAHRVQQPRKGMLRWVLRQLHRQQRRQTADTPQLVSGSSCDSLSGMLEQHCSQPAVPCWDPHTPPAQRSSWHHSGAVQPSRTQQQQQQPELCSAQLSGPPATHSSTASSNVRNEHNAASTSSSGADGPSTSSCPDGWLRRCVKAVLRPVVRAVGSAARLLASSAGPQGPGNNDNSAAERWSNVLTSLPFFAVGLHGLRNRRCPKGRHFALSFLVLGAVASIYHGADHSTRLRPIMRKLDYYTIAYTSTVLRRAAHIPLPRAVRWASVLVAPVKPTAVTGLNLLLVEGKFLRSALTHSHLRTTFKAHVGSAAVGMLCFAYEDVATGLGWPPVLHSLWHCLSAAAMACVHGLLAHLELAVLLEGVQLEGGAGSSS